MSAEDLRANPYVGLRPFFADDSLYFFGREQQTAELLEILRRHRFLGVVGSSGSGKSSLVRAGLLPGLLGGFLVQDRDRWRTIQIKPGDAPIGNLAFGLLETMGEPRTPEALAQLEKGIRESHTDAAVEFLKPRLERNDNVFLLVDQFEEIFAFRGIEEEDGQPGLDLTRRKERARRKAEAADFVDLLLALAEQRELPVYVALTMRTDFLGDCDVFYGLPEALNRGRYLVPRMTREQLRDAVECPALLPGAQIAPRLMDHVLNELGDRFDRLPVLQHALLRTWDVWQRSGSIGPIDLRHFDLAGGLERALNQDAEGALTGLDIGVTARIFKRLTDTDLSQRRARSPARVSELLAAANADRDTVEGIVRRFEADRRSFLHRSPDGKPDDPRVDISHESLIRQWDRLRGWVDEERRWRDDYRELVAKARKWERDEVALLQNPELQTVLDWREKAAPSAGWAARYAVAEGDFESAAAYVDKSVDVRYRNLAEAELQRRWRKIWSPLILAAEAVVGLWLVKHRGLLAEKAQQISNVKQGENWYTTVLDFLLELKKIFFSWDFVEISLFLGVCVGLNFCAKWAHRRFAFDKIRRSIDLSGGRSPGEINAKAVESRAAVDLQDITYASTFRRVGGYLIDALLQLLLMGAVMIVLGVYVMIFESHLKELSNAAGFTAIALIFISSWLYSTLPIISKRQATPGMRAVGILRTNLNGERLSFARANGWYACRFLSYLLYGLGFVTQPFTSKRQTLHDWMAGTVVVRRRPPACAPAVLPSASKAG